MEKLKVLILLILAPYVCLSLECRAPRAPANGLVFIFQQGIVVHFRCHPGFTLVGSEVSKCIGGSWSHAAPKCTKTNSAPAASSGRSQLFDWGQYGDGARRLPLINGIWPSQQLLNVGPPQRPGPESFVQKEIDIAELRQQQLEQLRMFQSGKQKMNHPIEHQDSKSKSEQSNSISSKYRKGANHGFHSHHLPNYDASSYFAEFKRPPIAFLKQPNEISLYDSSCIESRTHRLLPKLAPYVPNSYVYTYETNTNSVYPFNSYMVAKYRCRQGFRNRQASKTGILYCKEGNWLGDIPHCVSKKRKYSKSELH